jgi:hypothetical protein
MHQQRRLIIPLAMAGLFATATPAIPQNPPPSAPDESVTDTATRNPFWQASLSGGHYMVRLDRIASISRHRYLLDGAVIVDEITIDTNGQALARFYHLTPVSEAIPGNSGARIAERGRELIDGAARRTGTDVHNMVVKKYPETTHARTIEYRLDTAAQLDSLYQSLRTAWESGRGRELNIE